jgi:hypothetical protein
MIVIYTYDLEEVMKVMVILTWASNLNILDYSSILFVMSHYSRMFDGFVQIGNLHIYPRCKEFFPTHRLIDAANLMYESVDDRFWQTNTERHLRHRV